MNQPYPPGGGEPYPPGAGPSYPAGGQPPYPPSYPVGGGPQYPGGPSPYPTDWQPGRRVRLLRQSPYSCPGVEPASRKAGCARSVA